MKRALIAASIGALLASSCVVLRTADGIKEAFVEESDIGLAAGAFPTLIKVQEGLLRADPRNEDAAVQTAQLYVMYGNAFVQAPAEDLDVQHYADKRAADLRARALYRRAFALLGPLLDRRAPGIVELWRKATPQPLDLPDPRERGLPKGGYELLQRFAMRDLPLLYWSSASILAAYAVDPLDLRESSIVGLAKALMDRALALGPDWDGGSLQELALSVYASFPPELGGDRERALAAYRRGLEITKGGSASLYVTYASTICVAADDYAAFKASLESALAIDPDANPPTRLATVIAQHRARSLLDRAGDLFLDVPETAPGTGSPN